MAIHQLSSKSEQPSARSDKPQGKWKSPQKRAVRGGYEENGSDLESNHHD